MDIHEIVDDIDNPEGGLEKEPAPKIKGGFSKSKILKIVIFVVAVVVIIGGAVYFLLFKKSPSNFLHGHGGGRVIVNTVPNMLAGSLNKNSSVKPPVENKVTVKHKLVISNAKTGTTKSVPVVKVNSVLKVKSPIVQVGKPKVVKKSKNDLNDLFTVKYNHSSGFNPMNPVLNPVPPPMPSQVPAVPNFNLKSMSGIKPFSLTVSGYSDGLVAATCGGSVQYLKIGDSICGWTLLRATSSQAVFSQGSQVKKIIY